MGNPKYYSETPYVEIMKHKDGKWSWILRDRNGIATAISARSWKRLTECQQSLKEVRKTLKESPVVLWTDDAHLHLYGTFAPGS